MGFRISWLGACTTKAILLEQVGLVATQEPDEANENLFSVAELPSGWSIIWCNDEEWASPDRLEALARTTPTVSCMVDETIMAAAIDYVGPGERWQIWYGIDEEGVLDGQWPAMLGPLVDAARQAQAAENLGGHGIVDHLFDVPIEAARVVTGWRHDHWQFDWGQPEFVKARPAEQAG